MLSIKNLSIVTLLAVAAAAPSIASAEHRRDNGWMQLAEVGTHAHDAEDFVQVDTRLRLDRVQLRATEGAVPIDGLRIHFAGGGSTYTQVHRFLRQGEAVLVDLPDNRRIDMITIDYGNRGPYWRARQTARLEVMAQADARFDRRDRDYRARDYRDNRAPYYREPVRVQPYVGPQPYVAPQPYNGFQVRGGVQVQIR